MDQVPEENLPPSSTGSNSGQGQGGYFPPHINRPQVERPSAPPQKPPNVFRRLFGMPGSRPPSAGVTPGHEAVPGHEALGEHPALEPKPQQDWTPLNFKDRPIIRGPEIFDRTGANLRFHIREQLRSDTGKLLTAEQRKDVAKMIDSKKHHGLTRGKIYEGIEQMKKDNQITRLQAKKLRKELGATRRSSFF